MMEKAEKKYYAVKKGRNTGIYLSWPECREQIINYSGSVYKSFKTMSEAEEFLENNRTNLDISCYDLVAYTDGSYNPNQKSYSYAAIILMPVDEKLVQLDTLASKGTQLQYISSRNIAGEVEAVQETIKFAIDYGFKSILIYHDYNGLSEWANGSWATNKPISKQYKEFIDNARKKITIDFCHVKGHAGNYYNEQVDVLAKQQLGL